MLIAFDGTWQDAGRRMDGVRRISTVLRFKLVYDGRLHYSPGVGTRWGRLGRYLGGALGVGARRRVRDALGVARIAAQTGDAVFDLLGWSRGAALALAVANSLVREGIPVRWVGLIDLVDRSLLIPSSEIPKGARVAHARASDERRWAFHSAKLAGLPVPDGAALVEREFPGGHQDVGGMGDVETGVAVMRWLAEDAARHGVPINVEEACA